jgi:hypothetical protein
MNHMALYRAVYEAERDAPRARQSIAQAAAMQFVDNYMGWVAMVHRRLRGWEKRSRLARRP